MRSDSGCDGKSAYTGNDPGKQAHQEVSDKSYRHRPTLIIVLGLARLERVVAGFPAT